MPINKLFRRAALLFGSGKAEQTSEAFIHQHRIKPLVLDRTLGHFSNGEIQLEVLGNFRGRDVMYFAPETGNIYDDIMEVLLTLDCLRRHAAKNITLFLPDSLIEFEVGHLTSAMFGKFLKLFDIHKDSIRNSKGKKVEFEKLKKVDIIRKQGTTTAVVHGETAGHTAKTVAHALRLPVIDWAGEGSLKEEVDKETNRTNVIVVASMAGNPNQAVLEAVAMIYNLRRRDAAFIHLVFLSWHYARADRDDNRRVPISALVVGSLLDLFKPNSILVQDPHFLPIQGFAGQTPVEVMYSTALFAAKIAEFFKKNNLHPSQIIIAGVDYGAAKRAQHLARHLRDNHDINITPEIPIVQKSRDPITGEVKTKGISHKSKVKGKVVFFVDDMTGAGDTIEEGAKAAKDAGAAAVIAFVSHVVVPPDPASNMPRVAAKMQASQYVDALICLNTVHGATDEMKSITKMDFIDNTGWLIQNIRQWAWWLKKGGNDPSLTYLNDNAMPRPPKLRAKVTAHIKRIFENIPILAASKREPKMRPGSRRGIAVYKTKDSSRPSRRELRERGTPYFSSLNPN